MKVDFDSIIYIVITIVVLVISGLGSRKKKRLQEMNAQSSSGPGADSQEEEVDENDYPQPQPSVNPLQRIEQLLSGQMYESTEGESLETTMDEEELIMEGIRKNREELQLSQEPYEARTKEEDLRPVEVIKPEPEITGSMPGFFENIDELKKAVIYSEILNRKYD